MCQSVFIDETVIWIAVDALCHAGCSPGDHWTVLLKVERWSRDINAKKMYQRTGCAGKLIEQIKID